MKNRNIWSVCVCLFIRSRDTRELSRIFRLLWIPPQKSPPKSSYLPKFVKILAKIFLLKKFPEIKNFKPKKILQSSLSLEIQRTPTGRLSSQYWKPFALVWKPYWIYMKGSWSHITSVISVWFLYWSEAVKHQSYKWRVTYQIQCSYSYYNHVHV